MDKFHLKASCFHHITGLVGDEFDLVRQLMLLQLQLNEAVGHGGAVDGAVYLPHGVGDGADVVFVSVGDKEAPQLILVGNQIGEIGNYQIHAVHILLGEAHAAVHHNHVLAVFQHRNILADLVQTAKRDNFQFFSQNNTPFCRREGVFAAETSKNGQHKQAAIFRRFQALNRLRPEKMPAVYFFPKCANSAVFVPGKAQPGKRQQ